MKLLKLSLLFIVVSSFAACISNKQIIYFQHEKEDTSRTYQLYYPENYQLVKGDLLYIDVSTDFPEANEILERLVPNTTQNQNQGSNQGTQSNSMYYLNGYYVQDNGYMRFPLVDSIYVLDRTLRSVEDSLKARLEEYFDQIYVRVLLPGMKISLLGEFNGTGEQLFYQHQVNIMDVLARSGGLNNWANRKEIRLFRREDDQMKEYIIDITDADLINSEFFYLQHGDVLYAEPMKIRQYGFGESALATYSTIISTIVSTWAFVSIIRDLTNNNN